MKSTPFYRRHPLVCTLLLLLASTVALVAIALTQLDLDQFRQRLTRELSEILQQPIQMEDIHLTYQQGLAVAIDNLKIGDSKTLDIRIPQATGTLRLKPLLDGELLLDQVVLTNAHIKISLLDIKKPADSAPVPSAARNLFKRFGLSMLTIRQANLDLERDPSLHGAIPPKIENLNLVLRRWETKQSGYLVVSGSLPEQKGQFTLETELPPPSLLADWRKQALQVKLKLEKLSRDLFPRDIVPYLPERIDANIQMTGTPAKGTTFSGLIEETSSGKQLFSAEGLWVSANQNDRLQDLQVRLHNIPLKGSLQISRVPEGTYFQGHLKAENISLPPLLKQWKFPQTDRLVAGNIRTADIHFSSLINKEIKSKPARQLQYHANLILEKGRWAVNDTSNLEQISVEIKLGDQTLELVNGKSRFFDQPFSFLGEIHNWRKSPLFSLQVTAQPEASSLRQLVTDSLPKNLALNGPVQATLSLDGSRDLIRGELQINLDDLHAQFDPLFNKLPKHPGHLTLNGSWQPGQVILDLAKLDISDVHLKGTAFLPLGENDQSLHLQINNIDLGSLRPHSLLLQRLKAQGVLAVGLQHQGNGEFHGELELENAGARLTWLLADMNSANGKVTFDQRGLYFKDINAQLGTSPVQVDGTLHNWENFLLDLRVRSQAIRARDLIFANQEMTLYDLDGRLLINKGGIIFDPVLVRLEKGTDATVNGYLRNFSQPETYLEIDSFQHADILEVINLFIGPPKERPTRPANAKPAIPIRILARVAQGTLGGLNFQQAEGMIRSSKGLFTLFPLNFKHEDGYCVARVETDHGRLKVSGHLVDFDASVLHSEALRKQGLVTGTLRGDFYLEGNGTGDRFWASANGGGHLEVRKGTLRKFRSLASIFSLLNISQLFKLKLPDMDQEGMPFSRLKASVRIEDGVLSTDNLQIKSNAMNMSLLGKRNIPEDTVNLIVGVKPLRTVDKIITAIPVAGWILGGEEKALITAHFKIKGPAADPAVTIIPASSLSKTVLGIFRRTLGLPGTLVSDPDKIFFPAMDNSSPKIPTESEQPPDPGENK